MAQVPPAWRRAAERYGHAADAEAQKYGLPNGATLLAKIAHVESRFDMDEVSSAGARGGTQFMPDTRAAYLERYGVDPWRDIDSAVKATALFMRDTGLAGYNPGPPGSGGGQEYIEKVLRAPVRVGHQGGGAPGGRSRPRSRSPQSGGLGSQMVDFGLTAVLVIGGGGLVVLGLSRLAGTADPGARR